MSKIRWVSKKKKVVFEEISRPVSSTLKPLSDEDKKRIKAHEAFEKLLESLRSKGVSEEKIDVLERVEVFANVAMFGTKKSLVIELEKLANIVRNIEE